MITVIKARLMRWWASMQIESIKEQIAREKVLHKKIIAGLELGLEETIRKYGVKL